MKISTNPSKTGKKHQSFTAAHFVICINKTFKPSFVTVLQRVKPLGYSEWIDYEVFSE